MVATVNLYIPESIARISGVGIFWQTFWCMKKSTNAKVFWHFWQYASIFS